jgi:hypothetical protein
VQLQHLGRRHREARPVPDDTSVEILLTTLLSATPSVHTCRTNRCHHKRDFAITVQGEVLHNC